MILKDLRRLPKIGTMLILKRKGMHPKRHTKKYKEAFIVSTENVKKGKNMCYIQICKTVKILIFKGIIYINIVTTMHAHT